MWHVPKMYCPKIVACPCHATNPWLNSSATKPSKVSGFIRNNWLFRSNPPKWIILWHQICGIAFRANSLGLLAFLFFSSVSDSDLVFFSDICPAIFIAGNFRITPNGVTKCGKVNPNKMVSRKSAMMHFALSSDPLLKNAIVSKWAVAAFP